MSGASETVLGVVNAKSGICYMYICMYGWYVCHLNARAGSGFPVDNGSVMGNLVEMVATSKSAATIATTL